MNVLDLFSGIGGFSLGLERAGMRTVAFCEIEPYARAVLAKHWPNVPCYDDVRTLTAERLRADGIVPDVICGGFPCQDISTAGKGAGLAGERSGLFYEIVRIAGEVRPRYLILENVAALLSRGLADVLGELAALGFDAEWHCIPASAIGAPHRRDRVWIVAYANPNVHARELDGRRSESPPGRGEGRYGSQGQASDGQRLWAELGASSQNLAHPVRARLSVLNGAGNSGPSPGAIISRGELERAYAASGEEQWGTEPNVGRVADGVPSRVDRLKCLGNAVIPQIPEIIGRAIMRAEGLAP